MVSWRPPVHRYRVSVYGYHASFFGFRASGVGFRVSGFGFRVSGFVFRVSCFGFRVSETSTTSIVLGHESGRVNPAPGATDLNKERDLCIDNLLV